VPPPPSPPPSPPADRIAAALARARIRWLPAALAGATLTLAQPPVGWWPLLAVGWTALALALRAAPTPRAAAAVGWWAGAGFFATGVHWIGEAFLVEAARVWWYAPLMPLAIAALAAVLAAFWAGAFWAARRLARGGLPLAAALSVAMLGAELLRGWALTGFPWALQAYALVDTPAAQAAALTGSQALSALVVFVAAAPADALAGRRTAPLAALALGLALWTGGALRPGPPPTPPDAPVIRLVQPDVDQATKWDGENTRPIFDTLLRLSADPPRPASPRPASPSPASPGPASPGPASPGPALVVWPEVAVTFLYDESPQAQAEAAAASPPGAALAVGAVRRAAGGLRNSLIFQGADGAPLGVYDKRRLAPFGEYVPYGWLLGAIGLGTLGEGLSGFAPGPAAGPVALPGLPPAAALICYEAIFPGWVREAARGADWMLQVTNDGWFGDSGGPHQHLAQARMRAIELGLPLARGANTGVSAMIDAHGRIVASLPLGAQGALDSPLPPPAAAPTPYRRLGDAPFIALHVFGFLLLPAILRKLSDNAHG